jgi:restriction endonuclease S subunit
MNEDEIGFPIYRMNEIHNMFCDFEVKKYANLPQQEALKFSLNDRDVLFNRTNSYEWVGRTGLYRKENTKNFIYASYLVRFVPNQSSILPEYLTTFLNTTYGVQDVKRRSRQSINQTNVNPEEVKEIEIPLLGLPFQKLIKQCFDASFIMLKQSKQAYAEAEAVLLDELGLADFTPSTEAVSIKGFAESFGSTGRLDAEYYQPKYDQIEACIKENPKGYKKVKDFRTDNFRGFQPVYVQDGELDVINSKHILETTLDYDNFEKTSMCYWNDKERGRIYKGDILTYTTGANIGRTQVYYSDNKALASNHVNILRLSSGNAYYVGFVMNSLIGRMQTEKYSAGSAQAELYPKDIDEYLIPFLGQEKEEAIVSSVEKSLSLSKQSHTLLEIAKRCVELAIESDEASAQAWMLEQSGGLLASPSP